MFDPGLLYLIVSGLKFSLDGSYYIQYDWLLIISPLTDTDMVIIYLSSGITSRDSSEHEKRATLSVVKDENRHLNNSVMILTYALMNGEISPRSAAFSLALCLVASVGLIANTCGHVCAFSKHAQLFLPLHLSSALCVCICVYRKKPLSIILLSSAVPLPACISLPLAYITLASWKLNSRSSKRRKRNVTIHQRATQWHERVRKAFFMH